MFTAGLADYLQLFALIAFVVIVLGSILGTAPTPTARGTPAGIDLKEGFPIKFTLSLLPTAEYREISVKGSGIDGGDAIEITTQHNTNRETFYPRVLKKNDTVTAECAYDPVIYSTLETIINNPNCVGTETFPEGTTYCYWGYLQKFERSDMKKGERPTITISFVVTNYDPVAHVEVAPVLTNVANT